LQSVDGQFILRNLIWSFIGIMLTEGVLIMLVENSHIDMMLWGVAVEV
jgi:hypothetical protein